MKQITAQLVCERFDDSTGNEVAALTAIATDDENKSWSEGSTPSASLTITVTNPAAHGLFAQGKEYVVIIKPAKE
jgi:hypothetical protein